MYALGCPYTHTTGAYGSYGLVDLIALDPARRGARLQARRKQLVAKLKVAKGKMRQNSIKRQIARVDKHLAAIKGRVSKRIARRAGKGKGMTRRQTRAASVFGIKTKAEKAAAKKKAEKKEKPTVQATRFHKDPKRFRAILKAHQKMVQLRLGGQDFFTSLGTAASAAGPYKKYAQAWLMEHRSFYAALPLPQAKTVWQASLSASSPTQLTEVVNRSPEAPLPQAPMLLQSAASPVLQQAMQQAAQQAYYPQPSFQPGPGGSFQQAKADAEDEDDKDLDADASEDEGDDEAADAAGVGDETPWYKNPLYLGLGALGVLAAYGFSRKGAGEKHGKGKHGKHDDAFAAAAG